MSKATYEEVNARISAARSVANEWQNRMTQHKAAIDTARAEANRLQETLRELHAQGFQGRPVAPEVIKEKEDDRIKALFRAKDLNGLTGDLQAELTAAEVALADVQKELVELNFFELVARRKFLNDLVDQSIEQIHLANAELSAIHTAQGRLLQQLGGTVRGQHLQASRTLAPHRLIADTICWRLGNRYPHDEPTVPLDLPRPRLTGWLEEIDSIAKVPLPEGFEPSNEPFDPPAPMLIPDMATIRAQHQADQAVKQMTTEENALVAMASGADGAE